MPSLTCSISSWLLFHVVLACALFRVIPFDALTRGGLVFLFVLGLFSGMTYYVNYRYVSKKS